MVEWDQRSRNPVGEIVEVLGDPGENDTEMHAILAEFGLPNRFDPSVEEAAEKISAEITAEEVAARRDFREIPTFTIDPEDAKDFDDALSSANCRTATWRWSKIADVTHYVSPAQ
jgi:ribonuclease R